MDTSITLAGNLTADPEIRFTPSGVAVASFTVASTPRSYDKQTDSWRDGETVFLRVSAWRALAEHVAESVRKGARLVVVGRVRQHSWEADDGTRRTAVEVDADEVAVSLKFTTVTPARAARAAAGEAAEAGSPWDTSGPAPGGGGGGASAGGGPGDQPPF